MGSNAKRDPPLENDLEAIVAWRAGRLLASGFDPPLAEGLARERAFDLHALLELVDRGCPPALAARILAPLDREPPALAEHGRR